MLSEAQRAGIESLTKTVLHKLVYLVDVYAAEERNGKTFSEVGWRFVHFGPYAGLLAESADTLAGRGDIFFTQGHTSNGAEYTVYSVRKGLSAGISDLGLSPYVNTRVLSDIKRYARDLPGLLDYVYFRTAPMVDAKPGDTLHFSTCERVEPRDFKPVQMNKLSKGQLGKVRERLRALSQRDRQASEALPVGPYDEMYFAGMASLDTEPLPTDVQVKADIVD